MLEIVFRPIDRWPQEPTPQALRRHAHFKVGYDRTLRDLRYELTRLGAKRAYIQADVTERDIRNDGCIRADSQPRSPRIIVSADTKHGPISLPCDTYRDWHDNVRAIALSLQALRDVDRHGVTKRGVQYRGLKQLTAGKGPINSHEAARFLSRIYDPSNIEANARAILESLANFELCYRKASKELHPDVAGEARREEWDHLQLSAAILRDYFASKS